MNLDRGSQTKIMDLYPEVATLAGLLMDSILQETGLTTRITEGFRSYPYQDALFAKGRTAPGAIITWAKGGRSFHNFGVAFDICFTGGDPYLQNRPDMTDIWALCASEAEKLGLEPGAHFPVGKKDLPHFEKTYGMSEPQMDSTVRHLGISGLWSLFDQNLGLTNFAWQNQVLPDPMIGGDNNA